MMGAGRGESGLLEGGRSDGGRDCLKGRSARTNSCHFLPRSRRCSKILSVHVQLTYSLTDCSDVNYCVGKRN